VQLRPLLTDARIRELHLAYLDEREEDLRDWPSSL
jgi:hypothetical protein